MPRIIIVFVAIAFSITISARNDTKTSSAQVKKVIETFFKGLHNGGSTLLKPTLHTDIKIQTTFSNKEGEKILRT